MLILVENSRRLADELRAEQEMAMLIERDRKLLEAKVLLNFTGHDLLTLSPSGERGPDQVG